MLTTTIYSKNNFKLSISIKVSLSVLIFVFSETPVRFCVRSVVRDSLLLDEFFVLQSPQGKWHYSSWVVLVLWISCHPDVPCPATCTPSSQIPFYFAGSSTSYYWLKKEELAAKGIKPDLILADCSQLIYARYPSYMPEANDAALNFNYLERVEGGDCAHSRALSGGSPLVWENPPDHHGRLVSGSVC